ncbi:hypothetical protein QYF50_07165 [Paenibacillus vini]|uniref:hypothetical protein n=1 Tax=Paenibacillus vini TaxID=1476024 RepID=UPI0025B6F895|nr:hypothetical protein [Paenibacillus vini]MDN4067671.1 hypothetical protein [Paenibacillus vini]
MLKTLKDVAATASQKFYEVSSLRCEHCPAFWTSVDHWGEGDAGCTLHHDHLEFCSLSLLPQVIMKPYVKHKERQEELYWERVYERDQEKWEREKALGN